MTEPTDFEDAAEGASQSLPREFLQFLMENKKWWLLPIVLVLGLISLFAVLAGTGMAPFIYTMY